MLRVALGQMEIVPGRPDINTRALLDMVAMARQGGAQLVVFPEMAVPGYLLGDTWEQNAFLRDCEECGREIVGASSGLCIIFGNVAVDWQKKGEDGRVRKYNALFVASDGRLWGEENFPYPFRIKSLMPNYRQFDDSRHFYSLRQLAGELGMRPEELLTPVQVEAGGRRLSLGCLICEDAWSDDYAFKPLVSLLKRGPVDLLVSIASSPFTLGKNSKRFRVYSEIAREAGTPLIYVNNVGIQNNGKTVYTFDGSSSVYGPKGGLWGRCRQFEPELLFFDLDLDGGDGALGSEPPEDDSGTDALYRAVSYGTAKFAEAVGVNRVVIGLSGGIDSAVSACLYTQVLGPQNVLLVNMPSKFNSPTTKNLAERLARNLGSLYTVMPIQDSVDYTERQINSTPIANLADNSTFNLKLTPFMLENVQARDRGARLLAALAAAFGGAFTCNGNKSEMTVGYATFYGDLAGFFAALGDLWKYQVYELAGYFNEEIYGREVIPQGIIDLVPSAELSLEQAVDEGKGDPLIYPYHDYLFRAFMESWERAAPEDILNWYVKGVLEEKIGCRPGLVKEIFKTPRQFIEDLERWWKMYAGWGVAKRIQAPPVLAVSRRAYGFDHREAQNRVHFTAGYLRLKEKVLKGEIT